MIDGVIKYDFDFTPSKPLDKSLWSEIEQVRKRLYALKLIGEKDNIGYGNISRRSNNGYFVITGTQTGDLAHLQDKHYALVEKWDDQKFSIKSSGAIKPSSEALTHGTIYNLSSEIQAVIHIHSQSMWDFMLEKPYLQTANVLYGSPEMVQEVQNIYQDIDPLHNPKFVMRGHQEGIITFGKSLEEAEKILYEIIGKML